MKTPSPERIKQFILGVMEATYPTPQRHEDVARKLRWLTSPHRIAVNMDKLARQGVLRILPEGSDEGRTKQYLLVSSSAAIAVLQQAAEAVL